jgi:hypothetical protein
MEYLSDAFKARTMPNTKIRRTHEKPDLADLPLFNATIRTHEDAHDQAQPALTTPHPTQQETLT